MAWKRYTLANLEVGAFALFTSYWKCHECRLRKKHDKWEQKPVIAYRTTKLNFL